MGCAASTGIKTRKADGLAASHDESALLKAEAASGVGVQPAGATPAGTPPTAGAQSTRERLLELAATKPLPERLADVVSDAMRECDAPLCLVGLLDNTYIWYLSSSGLFRPCHERAGTFDGYLLEHHPGAPGWSPGSFVVGNAAADERFASHPAVSGPPYARFYAGVQMAASGTGHCYGTLLVMDFTPRSAPPSMFAKLRRLAARAVLELERDLHTILRPRGPSPGSVEPRAAVSPGSVEPRAAVVVDVTGGAWKVVHASAEWGTLTALREGGSGSLWKHLSTTDNRELAALMEAMRRRDEEVPAILAPRSAATAVRQLVMSFFPATGERLATYAPGLQWAPPAEAGVTGGEQQRYWCGVVNAVVVDRARAAQHADPPGSRPEDERRPDALGGGLRLSNASGVDETLIPPRFEGLVLHSLLGEGGSGRVYQGSLAGQQVAVKVIEFQEGADLGAQVWAPKFEALTSLTFNHPNLVPTLDFCVLPPSAGGGDEGGGGGMGHSGQAWIIQRLCTRGTLARAIEQGLLRQYPRGPGGPPNLRMVLDLGRQVASGLAYLHAREMLHGDLNCNNVLLTDAADSEWGVAAQIVDFGLLRMAGAVGNASDGSTGTVTHMAPEVLLSGVLTKASDVYSLGVLLWEMYCGQRAWAGASPARVVFAVTSGQRLHLPDDMPPALLELVDSCLQAEHAQRPKAVFVADHLEALLQDLEAGPR